MKLFLNELVILTFPWISSCTDVFQKCKEDNGTLLTFDICLDKHYEKPIIPSKPLYVDTSLKLLSLSEVSMTRYTFGLQMSLVRSWHDDRIHVNWRPNETRKYLSFKSLQQIFIPYVIIASLVKYEEKVRSDEVRFYIDNIGDGRLTFGLDCYVEHGCKMNTKKFPFDEQTCQSLWSSLMYFTSDVRIDNTQDESSMCFALSFHGYCVQMKLGSDTESTKINRPGHNIRMY